MRARVCREGGRSDMRGFEMENPGDIVTNVYGRHIAPFRRDRLTIDHANSVSFDMPGNDRRSSEFPIFWLQDPTYNIVYCSRFSVCTRMSAHSTLFDKNMYVTKIFEMSKFWSENRFERSESIVRSLFLVIELMIFGESKN